MSRASLVLCAVLVGLAAFVAAEHDASDLLFKSVSELDAPEVVSHQRALLAGRVLAATYPPAPGSSSKYTVNVRAKNSFWKSRVAVANALKATIQAAIPKDTATRKIKSVMVTSGFPQVASKGTETIWVYTVRVYYIEKRTLNAAEKNYNAALKAAAQKKIVEFKETSIRRRVKGTTRTPVYGPWRNVTKRVPIKNSKGKITGYRTVVQRIRSVIRYVVTPNYKITVFNRGIVSTRITKTWF